MELPNKPPQRPMRTKPALQWKQANGTGQMWRDLREGTPLYTWHSSPLRSLECDFPLALPSVEPASPRRRRWHALLACHWVLERATCVQSAETSAPIHDVRHENGRSTEQNMLPSARLDKETYPTIGSGTVRAAFTQLFVQKRTTLRQREFTFWAFNVADALTHNNLCRLRARESCSRTLEQEKYWITEASVTFWMQDNLTNHFLCKFQKATFFFMHPHLSTDVCYQVTW